MSFKNQESSNIVKKLMASSETYLFVIVGDVNTVAMVDIDGPTVLVLQRGSH